MVKDKRSLSVGIGAILLCAAAGAHAQDGSDGIIGPPQLKDFSLEPRETIVAQPPPGELRPIELSPPPPAAAAPSSGETPPRTPARAAAPPPASEPQREPAASAARSQAAAPVAEAPAAAEPAPPLVPAPVPVAAAPAPIEPAQAEASAGGPSYWYFAVPAVALALLGAAVVRRRRRVSAEPVADLEPAVAAAPPPPVKPRPDPVPRPWLELGLKAERAAFTDAEAEIAFELEIGNKGGSPARNLRIDVKLFNAGAEQDKEIGAFFRTAGRESAKLKLPGVAAGVNGVIQGTVGMPREEMRAMRLDERLLFIPVIAVNILYDWGEGRTGQTSKSYIVGREVQTSEKMGAFRVDQGPRIWRSVGQRQTKLAKRV